MTTFGASTKFFYWAISNLGIGTRPISARKSDWRCPFLPNLTGFLIFLRFKAKSSQSHERALFDGIHPGPVPSSRGQSAPPWGKLATGGQIPMPLVPGSECLGRVSGTGRKNATRKPRALEMHRTKSPFRAPGAGLYRRAQPGDHPGISTQGTPVARPKPARYGTQLHP